jgi:hypothetical protein
MARIRYGLATTNKRKRDEEEEEEDESDCKYIRVESESPSFPTFNHPFYPTRVYGTSASPLTRKGMKKLMISTAIRSKPKWYNKINDETILDKWRKELHVRQARDTNRDGEEEDDDEEEEDSYDDYDGVTEDMFNSVITKLRGHYSRLNDGSIEISPVDNVYQSDTLIPADVKQALLNGVALLENVPEDKKDWHPGSNNQVLDLVHPSLFCLVNGVSMIRMNDEKELLEEVHREGVAGSLNRMGQGEIVKFKRCLPDYCSDDEERSGNEYAESPERADKDYSFSNRFQWLPSEFNVLPDGTTQIETYINNLHPMKHKELYGTIEKIFGKFVPLFNKTLSSHYSTVDIRGHRLQVIVKLANIVLTPENPRYKGGSWHVEGMYNEKIVASGIYYYSSSNILESKLSFREAVSEPYERDKEKYNIYFETELNQERGSVITQEDRCIVFTNTMQHCVQPFHLADNTKPGERKILVFFLVDPNTRITSTLHVPPQQRSWYKPSILKESALPILPEEVIEQIVDYMGFPLSLEDAQTHREELMEERQTFVKENNSVVFERPCSLCEH